MRAARAGGRSELRRCHVQHGAVPAEARAARGGGGVVDALSRARPHVGMGRARQARAEIWSDPVRQCGGRVRAVSGAPGKTAQAGAIEMPERIRVAVGANEHTSAILYPAASKPSTTVILGHGAGADQSTAFMVTFATG